MQFGESSACFDGHFLPAGKEKCLDMLKGSCFSYQCSNNNIIITIGNYDYLCDYPGKILSPPEGYVG